MKKKLNSLQILRAVSAILVVLWHSSLVTKHTTYNYWPEVGADRALHYPSVLNHLDFGVDIFFCISGFIMYMLIRDSSPSFGAALRFLSTRAIRILPPYWLFTALIVLVFFISSGKFNVGKLSGDLSTDGSRLFTSMLLVPQEQFPILGVGWSLIHEALFYILCGFLIVVKLNRWLPEILGLSSIVAIFLELYGVQIFYGYFLSTFYFEFFLGALAYKFSARITPFPILTIAAGIGCYVIFCHILDADTFSNTRSLVRPIGGGLVGILLIIGLIGADEKYSISDTNIGRLFTRIGNASYVLYLFHWFVLSFMGKLIGLTPNVPVFVIALWHFLSILIAIALALFLAERFELPLHRRLLNLFNQSKVAVA